MKVEKVVTLTSPADFSLYKPNNPVTIQVIPLYKRTSNSSRKKLVVTSDHNKRLLTQ